METALALQELKKITTEQQKSDRLFEKNVKNLLSQLQEELSGKIIMVQDYAEKDSIAFFWDITSMTVDSFYIRIKSNYWAIDSDGSVYHKSTSENETSYIKTSELINVYILTESEVQAFNELKDKLHSLEKFAELFYNDMCVKQPTQK